MSVADNSISDLVRTGATAMLPEEVLRARTGTLVGVNAAAQTALELLDIRSVFDLAAARVFATAVTLLAGQRDPTTAEARANAAPGDAVHQPAGVPATELANQPIAILKAIGPGRAPQVASALDVATVRDLALWPPYAAAKRILNAAFFPDRQPDVDPEAPPDLLPRTGVYPTERIFFRKLVIDAVPPPGGEQPQPIEDADAIDLGAALGAPTGFTRLATGALLTFSQSWFSQGVTLGQLLHSTSLAPGESTRIAMIDWSRRTRASASEDISESELLSNTMAHSRAISEVTNATAREFQTGSSTSTVKSTTDQTGDSLGFEIGPIAFGGSSASSESKTEAMSASSSFGARDLAATFTQQINDRSQQNASSVRNRRASVVREVSQEEHEQISTRVVTNYNHMHALSVQYYEVVQAYRATTQLERAERCLFVPMKLLNFRDQALVDRWRAALASAALTPRAQRQLTVEYGVVEVIPQTPRIKPGFLIATGALAVGGTFEVGMLARAAGPTAPPASPAAGAGAAATPPPSAPQTAAPPGVARRLALNSPATLLAAKGWNLDQLTSLGFATGRVMARDGSDSVFVSDDALVIGFALKDGQAARFSVRRRDGSEVPAQDQSLTGFAFRDPVPITDLQAIAMQNAGTQDLRTSLVLQLNLMGTVLPLDVPIMVKAGGPTSPLQDVVRFGGVKAARELVEHLEANRLHYSQAVFRALDAATIGGLLARFTYRGLPLGQLVDAAPVAVTANFLVFRINVSPNGNDAEDPRWAPEQAEWAAWLKRRGLDQPAPKSEIIPLPSGGVFAEAVLGRFNAAEKIDLKRFWNWQDSPIPIVAPDIAAVQAGSRGQPEDLKPGQLSAPVLAIQTPTALPDPAGVAAIINAVQNGNMFRDMSGLAQTAALVQAALQATARGATAAGDTASQNMRTVMEQNTERLRIAAQLIAASQGLPTPGGGGGTPSAGRNTVSERGGQLNEAYALDPSAARGADGAPGAISGTGAGGSGKTAGGASHALHPQFEGSSESLPVQVLRQQLLGSGTSNAAVKRVVDAAVDSLADGGGGGGHGVTASVVDPFPATITMPREMNNLGFINCIEAASQPADVRNLCGAVIDLTGNPDLPPYVGHNDTDMLYVGSVAKIYPLLAAFELRRRVTKQAKDMILLGLSTATAGWQNKVFDELKKGWQPQLDATVQSWGRHLPSGPEQWKRFPNLAQILELSPDGTAELRDQFLGWIRDALQQNIEAAAGNYIRAVSYPYINGVLAKAGFFNPGDETGLWISGDYNSHDWLPNNGAGQPLTTRWRNGQAVSNFTGTALQLARFLGLMAQGNLVDSNASTQMINLLGVPWLKADLENAGRPFTSAKGKVGIGTWDNRYHDSAIVKIERNGDPARTISYALVVLGSPPDDDHAALRKLELAYDDCVRARHP